jgi:hypothetical protein
MQWLVRTIHDDNESILILNNTIICAFVIYRRLTVRYVAWGALGAVIQTA